MTTGDRLALVTGGNRGIGHEICRQFAQKDITVVLGARDSNKAQEATERLAAEDTTVIPVTLDVTSPESIAAAIGHVERDHGRLDILVNNAGVFLDKDGAAETIDLDRVRRTMETNTYGPILLCQAAIPLMRRQDYGRIVNLASELGSLTDMQTLYPAYRMSKTALIAYTRILAKELSGTGILVNAMCPGWVKTEMGGPNALREIEDSADTAIWLATLPDDGPTGGFFKDHKPLPW